MSTINEMDQLAADVLNADIEIRSATDTMEALSEMWERLKGDDGLEVDFDKAMVDQLCHDLVALRGMVRRLVGGVITKSELEGLMAWLDTSMDNLPRHQIYGRAIRAASMAPWVQEMMGEPEIATDRGTVANDPKVH